MNCVIGSDGKERLRCAGCMGERTTPPFWNSERRFCTFRPSQQEGETGNRDSNLEGMLNSSSEAVVVTQQRLAIKTRAANVRRIPESERGDADKIPGMRAVPWSPDGSDNAFDIQVGMERSAEMVPRSPGEVLMEHKVARTYLRTADFVLWGLSEGCAGCWYLRTGHGRQQAHSEACRKSLLKGDSSGSARLAAADERLNRALADQLNDTRPMIQE